MMNGTTVLWAHESQEWIPSPRSKEGILTDCFSHMRNRVTPMRSGGWSIPKVKLTARKAEFLSGKGKDQEAKAANRKVARIHNWADRAGNGDTHAERRLT